MAFQEMSPADRIRELSAINADVVAMIQSGGQAISALTNSALNKPVEADEDTQMMEDGKTDSLEERKGVFASHTKAYYTGLQAVVARLRRQAYALEEAGIISPEAPSLSSGTQQRQSGLASGPQSGQTAAAPVQEPERITNGGLGNLDVGWLNSRGNKVGAEKESELVEEAKKLLEDTLSRNSRSEDAVIT